MGHSRNNVLAAQTHVRQLLLDRRYAYFLLLVVASYDFDPCAIVLPHPRVVRLRLPEIGRGVGDRLPDIHRLIRPAKRRAAPFQNA